MQERHLKIKNGDMMVKKSNYDNYRMKQILKNLDKPLSYENKKRFKIYDDTEDFKRY